MSRPRPAYPTDVRWPQLPLHVSFWASCLHPLPGRSRHPHPGSPLLSGPANPRRLDRGLCWAGTREPVLVIRVRFLYFSFPEPPQLVTLRPPDGSRQERTGFSWPHSLERGPNQGELPPRPQAATMATVQACLRSRPGNHLQKRSPGAPGTQDTGGEDDSVLAPGSLAHPRAHLPQDSTRAAQKVALGQQSSEASGSPPA